MDWLPRAMAALACLCVAVAAAQEGEALRNPHGRTAFFLHEPIVLHARVPAGDGERAAILFRGPGGVQRRADVRVFAGRAVVEVPPLALAAGKWRAQVQDVPGAEMDLEIVLGVANTPFVVANYGGGIPDDDQNVFGGPGPMPAEERIALYRDVYGINHVMSIGQPGPFLPSSRDVDRIVRLGATITAQHVVAGQHQPGSTSTSWADVELQRACRYQVQHAAQRWRRRCGAAFRAVHYADEPGLTWGIGNEDGTMRLMFPGESGWYTGPLAVPAQYELYKQRTGKTPPDWRDPLKDFQAWLDFQRFRTTILGDLFAQLTRDVHAVDPGLLGYSQIYAWRAMAEGIYPPLTAKGVDVLASHGYAMWNYLGHAYPAHEVDAMRSGAWDKPLWYLAPWLGHQADRGGVRAVLYGVLARKVEGIIWPLDWMRHWPEAEEVSRKILPVSGVLHDARKPRDPVGLLHSRDQQLRVIAQRWKEPHPDLPYVGQLLTAWWAAMAAGFPTTRVVEEELLDGTAMRHHKVILAPGLTYIRPEIEEALEAFIQRGGAVVLDASATAEVRGAVRLSFSFRSGFDPQVLAPTGTVHSPNQRLAFDTLVAPHREELRAVLGRLASPLVECDNPHLVSGRYYAGGGQYVWLVNNEAVRDEKAQFVPVPMRARVELPVPEGGVLYDVFARRRVDSPALDLDLEKGDGRLYAMLPAAIGQVTVDELQWQVPLLTVGVHVRDPGGRPIDAVLPLELELSDPAGNRVLRLFRATRAGKHVEAIPMGHAVIDGEYSLRVRENVAGREATAKVRLAGIELPMGRGGPVEIHDRSRLAAMLAEKNEVLILVGRDAHRPLADALAEALSRRGVRAEVEHAAAYEGKDKLDVCHIRGQIFPFFGGVYNWPTAVNRDLILLGDAEGNALVKRLVSAAGGGAAPAYDLGPRRFGDYDPGAGRAVVFWVTGAFGLGHEAAVVYAQDEEGLRRGIDALLAVAEEKPSP